MKLILLLCVVVCVASVHFPVHLSKMGNANLVSASKRSADASHKAKGLDVVAEGESNVMMQNLVHGRDNLVCRLSSVFPGMRRFLTKDAVCRKVKQDQQQATNPTEVVSESRKNGKRKVLILMSDTGGGHRASAQAIDKSLKEQFPGKIDVDIIDIWTDHAKYPFNRFVPVYRYVAQRPMMWRGFYAYGEFPPTKFFTETWSWMSSFEPFKQAISSHQPDMVVSVHPLCQLMPIWIVEKLNKARDPKLPPIPFVTVVTDLGGAHDTWFDRRADAVFVPSDAVKRIAKRNRVKDSQIVQRGLPIRPAFWSRGKGKESARRGLGLLEDHKTVLVMGGGDGVGGLGRIANEIASQCSKNPQEKTQMVVICGMNEKLKTELSAKQYPSNMKVVVRGFVNNIHEYMGASDCIVTKAGPGTIAEAMTRGLPIVLSSFLPGQEAGNVPYVVRGGFGLYPGPNPKKIASTVAKLIIDDARLKEMGDRALATARPEATNEIAHDIGRIVLRSPDQTGSVADFLKGK